MEICPNKTVEVNNAAHGVSSDLRGPRPRRFLHSNAKRPDAPELPRDVVTAHHAEHFAADLSLDNGPPGDEAEVEPVVDHGEAAAGELRGTQQLSAHAVAVLDWLEGEPAFGGEFATDALDLPPRQSANQVGADAQCRVVNAARVASLNELVGALIHRPVHLRAEA